MEAPKLKKSRRVPAKKVSRACIHCRNAHITCEENRPCSRCVKKGLADTCIDAPRKSKKYLEGVATFEQANDKKAKLLSQSMLISRSLPVVSNSQPQVQQMYQDTTNASNLLEQNFSYNVISSNIPYNTSNQIPQINALPSLNVNLSLPSISSAGSTPQSPNLSTMHLQQSLTKVNPHLSVGSNSAAALNTQSDPGLSNNYIDIKRVQMNSSRRATPPPSMINGYLINKQTPSKDEINFLSSAADSEYAILGNIIDQSIFNNPSSSTVFTGTAMNSTLSISGNRNASPAFSNTNSDDFDTMHYQPLMANDNTSPTISSGKQECSQTGSPFVKPLQPIQMAFGRKKVATNIGEPHMNEVEPQESPNQIKESKTDDEEPKLQYSDLYPEEPQCDLATNQYFIGTMSTIDGIKTHTFPEVVKQISKFKRKYPKKFRERNRKSAISFSIGILEDVLPEIEISDQHDNVSIRTNPGDCSNPKCGLMYNEPSEIYEKVKSPFAYVKPYHDLNLYLKSRFSKEALVQVSKSIAEYRPSFIAGMTKLKEDDLIFAEQCFQRTLLEYDSYIGISGTPTMVWRRTSQIAYVGDEFCILTGWSKENLVGKSTFAVEIMDDKSCVEYFKIFSKIAFGDLLGETMTECTLLTPKGENIRTSSTWTLKRDVFGIPMMIIATFLPILT